MLLAKQLIVSVLIILLISCNTGKEKEETNLSISTKDKSSAILKGTALNPGTTNFIDKKNQVFEIRKTPDAVADNSETQPSTSLETDLKQIEKGFQDFVINSNADTTLFCKEGTVLKISRSAFLIASTSVEVKGMVTFQVKEFYEISDILSAGLTTQSNGNILETGGMLFIQATADGQLCKLKDNSPIEISFPFAEKKDGMLLFNGSWKDQRINWELLPTKEDDQVKDIEDFEVMAEFPGGADALRKFMYKNIVSPDSLIDISGLVQLQFVIDETGKVRSVNFMNRSHQGFKDVVLNTFSKMPRWKPAKRNGLPVRSTYFQTIRFCSDEGNINDTIFKNEFEATVNDTNINKVKTADISQYIFSTSKLGWINCDRFYNSPKPRTDLYVDCGHYTELDIKLVFHSFKAILDNFPSKTASKFQNIPGDEAITVVVVKKINDDTFISLTESNTNLGSINNLAFEKVTMEKLKQKLEQLNNAR